MKISILSIFFIRWKKGKWNFILSTGKINGDTISEPQADDSRWRSNYQFGNIVSKRIFYQQSNFVIWLISEKIDINLNLIIFISSNLYWNNAQYDVLLIDKNGIYCLLDIYNSLNICNSQNNKRINVFKEWKRINVGRLLNAFHTNLAAFLQRIRYRKMQRSISFFRIFTLYINYNSKQPFPIFNQP